MKKPPPTRYTPTCVGKTAELKRRGLEAVGTPPHAWGKHCGKQITRISHRYTPTCVGKTQLIHDNLNDVQVHPHMRGENSVYSGNCVIIRGTPPHAWGKRRQRSGSRGPCRYTPTCVGKTPNFAKLSDLFTVHPHMRGENEQIHDSLSPQRGTPPHAWGKRHIHAGNELPAGTPPHAWGKRWRQPGCGAKRRYTPTCVGKT